MDVSKLTEVRDLYYTIDGLLWGCQFHGSQAEAVVRVKTYVEQMISTLSAQIKEATDASTSIPENTAGVAGSGTGNKGRKSRKRKGD